MPEPLKLLIVDENGDGRMLLSRTLLRKFPRAALVECADDATALTLCATDRFDAILVHRAGEMDGEALITAIRQKCPETPILALSGIDRSKSSISAGASRFLDYDKWLMAGITVEEMLSAEPSHEAPQKKRKP